LRMRISRPSR